MNYTLVDILSYSIAAGAIIGLIRLKHIDRAYYPFILLLWIGLLAEIMSSIVIHKGNSNAIFGNIYVLSESILLFVFFKRLGLFSKIENLSFFFPVLFVFAWIWENFIYSDIGYFNSYFRILYSFIVVLMSIHMINRILAEDKRKIIKNPLFLILIGFIIFFTYKTLIEIFWIYGLNSGLEFRTQVYRIMTYINFSVNLIFAIALLWTPRKREFTLL